MADPAAPRRVSGLDALRGAALIGMVAFHLEWDLAALGWPVADPAASPGWRLFGDAVAAAFLGVSGASLALARPRGPLFALRRLAVLAGAGALVTAASLWFSPGAPILFGILQCIAACDALALLALALPGPARLGLAALAAAAPALVGRGTVGGSFGAVLGLSAVPPTSLDHRPLLPWLAAVLLGTVLGDRLAARAAPARRAPGALARLGRHSLMVYLLHQPVLYGALRLAGPPAAADAGGADPFTRQCRADCAATGAAPRLCAVSCACTAERLAAEAGRGTPLASDHLDALSAACGRAAGAPLNP